MYTVDVYSRISNIRKWNFGGTPLWPDGEWDVGGVVTKRHREHGALRGERSCRFTVRNGLYDVLRHNFQGESGGVIICLSRGGARGGALSSTPAASAPCNLFSGALGEEKKWESCSCLLCGVVVTRLCPVWHGETLGGVDCRAAGLSTCLSGGGADKAVMDVHPSVCSVSSHGE